MFAFLEDCPLGYEDDAIMLEAYSINAERAILAQNTFERLENIRLRKQQLRSSQNGTFDDMMAFYEEEEEKDKAANEKKQGLASKAWDAIKKFFGGIRDFFAKMGKPKDDGPDTVNLPAGLDEATGLLAKFANALKAVIGAGAVTIINLIDPIKILKDIKAKCLNLWEDKHGKTVKTQRKEALAKLADFDRQIETFNNIIASLGEAEAKTTVAQKEEVEKAREVVQKELDELTPGGLWGLIKKGLQKIGEFLKTTKTRIFNMLSGGEKPNDENPKHDEDEHDDDDASDNGGSGGNGSQNDNSDPKSSEGTDEKKENTDNKPVEKPEEKKTPEKTNGEEKAETKEPEKKKGFVGRFVDKVTGKDKKGNEDEDKSTNEEFDDVDFDLDTFLEDMDDDSDDDFDLDAFLEEMDADDEPGDTDPILTEETTSWEEELGAILDSIS